MMGRARIPRVRALDGLRGLAVAGVLLFHGGHLAGGYLGVDLFFVLSGFLITSLLLTEGERNGSVGLGGFWARRARRLLPALAGLLVGVGVYCLVFADPSELNGIRGDAIATVSYVANWRAVFAHTDYWALFRAPSPLQHTWSLAIEEQFYLVWPLVVVGLLAWWKRSTPRALLVVCLVGAAASTALTAVLYSPGNVSRVYYGTDTRAAAILLGGALAAALVVGGPVRGRGARIALEVAGVAGLGVLAYAWTQVGGQDAVLYRGGFFVCGLAVVAVIAAAAHPEAGPISRVLSWRPLCILGLISYGVYLWHWPVFIVLDRARTGIGGWWLLAVRVLVTLAIAGVSYVLLEQPVRHGALSAASWRWLAPATAVIVVVVVVASTVGGRPPIDAAAAKADSAAAVSRRAAAAGAGTQRVMVVGNSVALFIGRGMQAIRSDPPIVALDAALPGCVFPSGATVAPSAGGPTPTVADTGDCDTGWRRTVQRFRPDVVFFIEQCCSSRYLYDGQRLQVCSAAYARLYERSLRNAVKTLHATGGEVVITTAPYSLAESFNVSGRRDLDCTNALRRRLAPSVGARLVDLFEWTCPHGVCRHEQDGVKLRPDGTHFKGEAARIVAAWLLAQARAQPAAPAAAAAAGSRRTGSPSG